MDRETYRRLLSDLTSGDPERIMTANRELYAALVARNAATEQSHPREADLVLAEVGMSQ